MEVLVLPTEMKLADREREFLATTFYLNKFKKLKIESKEMAKESSLLMGLSGTQDIYVKRNKLKEKGWLVQTPQNIEFCEYLTFNTIPNKVNFKCLIQIDEKTS